MACNLQSLITILEHILNPQQAYGLLDDNKHQLQSLLQRSTSLQHILEKARLPKVETLDTQIREALHRAEDIIESYMVDQKLSCSSTFPTSDLDQVTQQLDSAVDRVTQLVDGAKKMSSGSTSSSASSSTHDPSSKRLAVGVDDDLRQLKDRLTGKHSKLDVVSIAGMGGIVVGLDTNSEETKSLLCNCISKTVPKVWSLLSSENKFLKSIQNPVDF